MSHTNSWSLPDRLLDEAAKASVPGYPLMREAAQEINKLRRELAARTSELIAERAHSYALRKEFGALTDVEKEALSDEIGVKP